MADYEFEDVQGNRYRLIRGAGPGWHHANNLGRGSSMVADQLLGSVADAIVYKAYDHFYFDVLSALPDASPLPREALSDAIASSHLVLERLDSALAIGDEEPDPRQMLRVRIQSALFNIIAGERAEAAMHERMLSQESAVTKVAIYTGAFMTGIGSSAWGLALWAKEVSDVVNPVVRIHNNIKAIRAAWDSENFAEAYSSNILSAEKRELVEALGFDPTAINAQQIDEAIAMSDLVMSDESLREMLYRFVKDYAEAQHSIEIAEVAGSGAFEIILTIILAAVTGGAGVLAMVGSKAALIRKFSSVGDLLSEFAQASKKIALRNSKRSAKQEKASFKDLETSEGRSEKTDARGAEDGNASKKRSKKVEPKSLAEAEAILANRRKEIAANGYQPKYSDAELKEMAETGDIGKERFQVRFMESKHLTHRDTKDVPLSGAMGQTMQGESGTGAKYWSTSFDQLEDADSDPKLISEKLGLTYNPDPEVKYALVIVDTQVAAPITGVKSVSATFKNVGEFANTELPKKFPKEFTDKAMTPEFQAEYSKHYKDAEASGIFEGKGNWNSKKFSKHLDSTNLSSSEKKLMKRRFEMHDTIGNNDDYLGNGLTKNNNNAVDQEYGAVETLNFERNEVNLSQLKEQNAISVLPELSRI